MGADMSGKDEEERATEAFWRAEYEQNGDADPDGLGFELYQATTLGSRAPREAINAIWKAIADGRASEASALAWVAHVARKVTTELIDDYDGNDRQRGTTALRALGLDGAAGKHNHTKEITRIISSLPSFNDDGSEDYHATPTQVFSLLYSAWEGSQAERKRIIGTLQQPVREALAEQADKRRKPRKQ